MTWRRPGLRLVLLPVLTACAAPASTFDVREITCPAAAGSAQPEVSAGGDGRAVLSWIEELPNGTHALRFSFWKGNAWSAPATVAQGADWFVNWADFPSVTSLDDGTLVAHWLQKTAAAPYAYAVMLSRSTDSGRTWSDPLSPHDASPTEHGFVSIVPLPKGRAAIVWLDGRETTGGHEGTGSMTLRTGILGSDGTLERSDLVDGRVCDCCQTSAAALQEGELVVAYRDRSEGEVRDIALVHSDGGRWSDPRGVHQDGWKIAGCPVNGPTVAVREGLVAVAWFTAAGGKGQVRLALSADGGRTFDPPRQVDLGQPMGRVDLVFLEDGALLVSWVESSGEGARILARRAPPAGPLGPPLAIAETTADRAAGFPRMTRSGSTILVAWADPAERRVRTGAITAR